MSAEDYLDMFESAIKTQADLVGKQKAHDQARRAGLTVSPQGHITSCVGNPIVVVLRLVRMFTEDNNMAALAACTPLIEALENLPEPVEIAD